MDVSTLLTVTTAIFVWCVVSARLTRADLSAPIVFVAVGGALAGVGLLDTPSAPAKLRPLVEVTLVWVLFSDAARVPIREVRADLSRYARLLGIGLPLTVVAGWTLAMWLFPGLGVWLALLVGAALAPTDAALGLPVVTNPLVPSRIRRLLTVESGLNDGIVTPVVMLALAGAASAEGVADAPGLWVAAAELAVGGTVGALIGFVGGWLLEAARRSRWAAEEFSGIAVLALAIAAYAGATVAHCNGFVAAFCGGLAFGAVSRRRGKPELVFLEQASGLVSLLVWLTFGAIAVPIMMNRAGWVTVIYAVLSLTVVRMLPVALASIGSGVDRGTVLFLGWFGPRGLASLVFALLALEELGHGAEGAVSVVGATVFLSVLAHGLTATPLADRYGRSVATRGPEPTSAVADPPSRHLPFARRRTPAPGHLDWSDRGRSD